MIYIFCWRAEDDTYTIVRLGIGTKNVSSNKKHIFLTVFDGHFYSSRQVGHDGNWKTK